MVEYGFNDTLLLGKECNTHPREYTIEQLQIMANKVGLITTRINYEQLCNGLRAYFLKNGITTEEELQSHIPQGPTIISETPSRVLGANIDLDILFNSNPDEFLRSVEYFQNLEKYSQQIEILNIDHISGSNGYIRKLQYISDAQSYSVILKYSQGDDSDNLVYEYLVGNCINEYSRFYPFFSKTYSVSKFKNEDIYKIFRLKHMPEPFHTYIQPLDISNIETLIINGCRFNEDLTLFTQYIPHKYNLMNFLTNMCLFRMHDRNIIDIQFIDKLYQITTILHMVYQLLSSFADKFTHYDLHMCNIVLVEVPNDRFIHVVYNYPDGRVLSYNTCYIPVIIDYGHCFVNCDQLSSREVLKLVCKNDRRNVGKSFCNDECGNNKGYIYNAEYTSDTDIFVQSHVKDNHYIDYTRKNISHDCRLLHELLFHFDFNSLPKEDFIVKHLVVGIFKNLARLDNRFGTHEEIESHTPIINNVIIAADKLTNIISDPQFNSNNDQILSSKALYSTLHIWTDLSHPFQFR